MTRSATTTETFASDFERVRGGLPGNTAPWLAELRRSALEGFAASGFPSVRDEDWKYTSVLPMLRERLEPVLPSEVNAGDAAVRPLLGLAPGANEAASLLVFVDGTFQPSLSRMSETKGLRVSSLRAKLESDPARLEPWLGKYLPASAHAFTALNTAFLDDGAVIETDEGKAVEGTVHVVYVSSARAKAYVTHPRNVLVAGAGSSVRVVEHYVGADRARYLTNTATEIVLGRGSSVAHVRLQDESNEGFHVARVEVEQSAGSSFRSHALAFGAALSRTEISVRLAGEEAECDLAGLYAIDANRHADHHLFVDHVEPRTNSNQLYKGVLEDSARGVFSGRVVVRAGSQKIRAMQSNPSLLLGSGAVAETRPQLEIYADDVKCNHGATIGRLDEDALFYLQSRGIAMHEARRILVSGFAAEVLEGVTPETLRDALVARVAARIGALGRGPEHGGAP